MAIHLRPRRCGAGPAVALVIGLLLVGSAAPARAVAATETTTSVVSSANPSVWGQQVTFTATVTADGASVPTGTITLTDQGTAVGPPVVVDAAGKARFPIGSMTVGVHAIVAGFTPDTTAFEGSSGPLTQTVTRAASAMTASASPGAAVPGQLVAVGVALKAVAPGAGTPTGNVQFTVVGGPELGSLALDATGKAAAAAMPPTGNWHVRASYSGDEHFVPSSALIAIQVDKAGTTTTLTSSPNPVAPGGTLTVTVNVSANPPADLIPFGGFYGSLQLAIDGQALGSPVSLEGGWDGFSETLTAPEIATQNTLSAFYSGDLNTQSSSASLVQVVGTPSPPPAPVPAPKPSAKDSLTALNGALATALKRRGFAALTKTSRSFSAPAAGVLEQRVYSPKAPKSARSSAAKPVLIASVRRTFAAAGKATVRLKVTAAGRRAMRRARSLKFAVVSRFTPSGGTPEVVVKSMRAKRSSSARAAASSAWQTLDIRVLR